MSRIFLPVFVAILFIFSFLPISASADQKMDSDSVAEKIAGFIFTTAKPDETEPECEKICNSSLNVTESISKPANTAGSSGLNITLPGTFNPDAEAFAIFNKLNRDPRDTGERYANCCSFHE